MATQLGQFNKDAYVQATDSNGVITDLKFKTADKNAVTVGFDNSKVTFKNGNTSLSVEAALATGTCTGNAATATKLLTAITIGGVDFDGSKNIDLPGVNTTGNQNTTGNAATATKLSATHTITITNNTNEGSAASFDGSNNISVELPTSLSVNNLTAFTIITDSLTTNNISADGGIFGNVITSLSGNATNVAASQKLATDISSAVLLILGLISKIKYGNCLKFTATESDATIAMKKNGNAPAVNLMTSIDDGITWQDFIVDETVISLNLNKSVLFKAGAAGNDSFGFSEDDFNLFVITGNNVEAAGNIMSLLDGEKFDFIVNLIIPYAFYGIFQNCTSLTAAPELPATTLADNCYTGMFRGCTSLTQAPALPATQLVNCCYAHMFQSCTSLTVAPQLPATQLANSCYANMFQSCTSLTQAPALPAIVLAYSCYFYMFNNCTSLILAPDLLATLLNNLCYSNMFCNCIFTDCHMKKSMSTEYDKSIHGDTTKTVKFDLI